MINKVKYTPQGFSYVDVSIFECMSWGGLGICDGCGKQHKELKLIWVLRDTYCKKCFDTWLKRTKNYSKEDIEHDLRLQKDNDIRWYKRHGVI